jgi:hypothetical protein
MLKKNLDKSHTVTISFLPIITYLNNLLDILFNINKCQRCQLMPYTFTKATTISNMLLLGVLICNIVCILPSNHVTMCIACNESHQLLQFYSQCKFYYIYENESCLNLTIFQNHMTIQDILKYFKMRL